MSKKNVYKKDGKALVSKVKASHDLKGSIKKAVDLIGGLEKTVSCGDKVIVKPNFNSDDPFPASSDPEFVKAAVSLLHKAGASQVVIMDPWEFPQIKHAVELGLGAKGEDEILAVSR